MILSLEKNFIFLHVPKTAGQSFTKALEPYSRPYKRSLLRSSSRRLPFQESPATVHFRGHETARGMISKLGRAQFDAFFTFACVRNPFDHAVSHYEYMKQYRIAATARKIQAMSFVEYLRYRQKRPFWNDNLFARFPDQTYFVQDSGGAVAVNELIRFETLNEDFERVAAQIGLEDTRLPYVNKTVADRKPLESYFDNTARDRVLELYSRDFDNFGYARDVPTN